MPNTIWRQAFRYLVVGGSNTAVTFVLLALLAHLIDHSLAYTIVFALGVAYTVVLSGRYVFASHPTARRTTAFVCWYLGVYVIGLGVIHIADLHQHRSGLVVALATVIVTAPLTFLGGRLIYRDRTAAPSVERYHNT
jgi:putative flippase GtrA